MKLTPLSPYHEMFYNEWKLDPASCKYNIVFDQTLSNNLNISKLKLALSRFITEHFLFGCCVKLAEKQLYFVLNSDSDPKIKIFEHSKPEDLAAFAMAAFDLENGPLYRFGIFKQNNGFRIILVIHHIIMDGSGGDLFINTVSNYYNDDKYTQALSISEQCQLLVQHGTKLHNLIQNNSTEMLTFWQEQFNSIEAVDCRFLNNANYFIEIIDPKIHENKVTELRFNFNETESQQFKALAKNNKITPYWLGQCIFAILVNYYTGCKDFAISYPLLIRDGLALICGVRVNTSLRTYHISESTTLDDLINRCKDFNHKIKQSNLNYTYCPVDSIVNSSNASLLNIGFADTNLRTTPFAFDGTEIIEINQDLSVDYLNRFIVDIETTKPTINFRIKYNKETIDSRIINSFSNHYKKLTLQILNDLNNSRLKPISTYDFLSIHEYNYLINYLNQTSSEYAKDKTLHQLFEEQVTKTPDDIALVYEDIKLSYYELNSRANQFAHYLLENYHVKSEDLVALCLSRNELVLISILAILKLGCAYVPIDPNYPKARVLYILDDANAKLVITNPEFMELVSEKINLQSLVIDHNLFQELVKHHLNTNLNLAIASTTLAYIIYTSGTTGKPKGVMIEHKNVINLVHSLNQNQNLLYQRVLWYSNYIFDAHVWEIYHTLLRGATLFLLKEQSRYNINELENYIATQQIELAFLPPALLTENVILKLKVLFVGGESTPNKIIAAYLEKDIIVLNGYGPSETCVFATTYQFHSALNNAIIGRPLTNVKCYVLNPENLKPLPIGAIGELYIGGEGLARGYLNQMELTEKKFIANPFQSKSEAFVNENSLIYKTGDIVRYLPDGNIEYCGRADDQVKIRGQRIELTEIEQILNNYQGVKQSVALVNTKVITSESYAIPPDIKGVITPEIEPLAGIINMLPIQEWFFKQNFAQNNHWNQAFLIRVPELDINILKQAIKYLVNYHDCFRIYYHCEPNGQYLQYYAPQNARIEVNLHILNLQHEQIPIEQKLTEWQSSFNIELGNLAAFGYIDGYSDQSARIFCAAHHLIIDVVSWYIIQHDLERVYKALAAGQVINLLPTKTASYRQWSEAIKDFALTRTTERNYWQGIISGIAEFNQQLTALATIHKDNQQPRHAKLTIIIKRHVCNKLLEQAQRVDQSIHEILVAAVGFALSRLLSNQDKIYLTLEGHGREQITPNVDLSRTIGWFTSMYPVKINIAQTIIANLNEVKALLEEIPYNGVNYGHLYGYDQLPLVSFNYLGLISQNTSDWELCFENSGMTISERNHDFNLLNLNSWITNGELQINIASMLANEHNEKFIQLLTDTIHNIVEELSALPTIIEENQKHISKYIVGYYVADKEIDKEELHKYLLSQLPVYAVPHKLIQVPVVPITMNGKIDKSTLLMLDTENEENEYISPRTAVEQIICNAFANILGEDRMSINDDFFKKGGDSILAIKLVMQLQNHFKINVRDIFSLRTPRKLSQHLTYSENYIKNKLLSLLENGVSSISLQEKTQILQLPVLNLDKIRKTDVGIILLTGATGYLGCNILYQLMKLTNYKICTLIRAQSQEDAMTRFEHKYQLYFKQTLETHYQSGRLIIIAGDLSQNKFGLVTDKYDRLTEEVDSIIHSAALVKQLATDEELYNANVLTTINLLKFALTAKAKNFHYISTISLLKYNTQSQERYGNHYTESSEPEFLDVNNNNPYLRSKLQAELEVMAYRKLGVNASIYRVGNLAFIANDCSTQENIQEIGFANWIKYFFNNKLILDTVDRLEISPVDWTAEAIVNLFDKSVSQNQVYHVFNPNTFSLRDFIHDNPEYNIEVVTQSEFIKTVIAKLDSRVDEGLLRFMLLQGWLEIEGVEQFSQRQYSQDFTQHVLTQLNFKWSNISNHQFRLYLNHIREKFDYNE